MTVAKSRVRLRVILRGPDLGCELLPARRPPPMARPCRCGSRLWAARLVGSGVRPPSAVVPHRRFRGGNGGNAARPPPRRPGNWPPQTPATAGCWSAQPAGPPAIAITGDGGRTPLRQRGRINGPRILRRAGRMLGERVRCAWARRRLCRWLSGSSAPAVGRSVQCAGLGAVALKWAHLPVPMMAHPVRALVNKAPASPAGPATGR